jgi:hypothetical protein
MSSAACLTFLEIMKNWPAPFRRRRWLAVAAGDGWANIRSERAVKPATSGGRPAHVRAGGGTRLAPTFGVLPFRLVVVEPNRTEPNKHPRAGRRCAVSASLGWLVMVGDASARQMSCFTRRLLLEFRSNYVEWTSGATRAALKSFVTKRTGVSAFRQQILAEREKRGEPKELGSSYRSERAALRARTRDVGIGLEAIKFKIKISPEWLRAGGGGGGCRRRERATNGPLASYYLPADRPKWLPSVPKRFRESCAGAQRCTRCRRTPGGLAADFLLARFAAISETFIQGGG